MELSKLVSIDFSELLSGIVPLDIFVSMLKFAAQSLETSRKRESGKYKPPYHLATKQEDFTNCLLTQSTRRYSSFLLSNEAGFIYYISFYWPCEFCKTIIQGHGSISLLLAMESYIIKRFGETGWNRPFYDASNGSKKGNDIGLLEKVCIGKACICFFQIGFCYSYLIISYIFWL